MRKIKFALAALALVALCHVTVAQKNSCTYFTVQGLTTDACAGDYRTFQVITDICTESMSVVASSSNSNDVAGVINYSIDPVNRKTTWNIGLSVAEYTGTPHTVKTFLRTITLTFTYECCDVIYTQTRTINAYECPLR
ncbi:MAG: hypothetical protein ACOYXT_09720 [Bacteroidota bacterium]